MNKFVELNITNYLGFPHYYGRLTWRNDEKRHERDVSKTLTRAEAKHLNFLEPGAYRPYEAGDTTTRFDDKIQLIEYAIVLHQELFPNLVLIEGNGYNPDPVHVALEPYKSAMNKLSKKANDLGWYDGPHEKEVDQVCSEWIQLLQLAIQAQKKEGVK